MGLTVAERGRTIATLRFVSVKLMETVAAWTPTTPEMEAKIVLGRHIWDFAQHADLLGRRTFELRLPPQHSVEPNRDYRALLDEVARQTDTAGRLSALYSGLLPSLGQRLQQHVKETDEVLDAPSHVILDRIQADYFRMTADARSLAEELGCAVGDATEWGSRERALQFVTAS